MVWCWWSRLPSCSWISLVDVVAAGSASCNVPTNCTAAPPPGTRKQAQARTSTSARAMARELESMQLAPNTARPLLERVDRIGGLYCHTRACEPVRQRVGISDERATAGAHARTAVSRHGCRSLGPAPASGIRTCDRSRTRRRRPSGPCTSRRLPTRSCNCCRRSRNHR